MNHFAFLVVVLSTVLASWLYGSLGELAASYVYMALPCACQLAGWDHGYGASGAVHCAIIITDHAYYAIVIVRLSTYVI